MSLRAHKCTSSDAFGESSGPPSSGEHSRTGGPQSPPVATGGLPAAVSYSAPDGAAAGGPPLPPPALLAAAPAGPADLPDTASAQRPFRPKVSRVLLRRLVNKLRSDDLPAPVPVPDVWSRLELPLVTAASGRPMETTSAADTALRGTEGTPIAAGLDSTVATGLDSSTTAGLGGIVSTGVDSSVATGQDITGAAGFDSMAAGLDSSTAAGLCSVAVATGVDSTTGSEMDRAFATGLDLTTAAGLDSMTAADGLGSPIAAGLRSTVSAGLDSSRTTVAAAEAELDLQQLFEFPVPERRRPSLSPLHRAIESMARELANIPLCSPPAAASATSPPSPGRLPGPPGGRPAAEEPASESAGWQPTAEPADLDLLLNQLFDG